ncbi:Uncharacterised protein [Mycobacterium tuberculosis]|nr:Uncharacterised protein [Mycobacterium tuberculosis]
MWLVALGDVGAFAFNAVGQLGRSGPAPSWHQQGVSGTNGWRGWCWG